VTSDNHWENLRREWNEMGEINVARLQLPRLKAFGPVNGFTVHFVIITKFSLPSKQI